VAKHRSLDDDFWKDPKLRKEPLHLRVLLAGLITEAADDEGRFKVEPYGWLESYFSRHDPVTEDDIAAAWTRICELGVAVAYGDGQYGFLTAWFRRQLVQNPRPSTLPEPPPIDGTVTTRSMMGVVYDLCLKTHTGKQSKTWLTVAAHWWASLQPEERLKLVGGKPEEVTSEEQYAKVTYSKILSRLGRDVTGRERKDNDSARSATRARRESPGSSGKKPEDPFVDAPTEEKPKNPRVLALESCLAAFGLTPADLPGDRYGSYAKAMNKLIESTSIEELQSWADHAVAEGGRALGTGAKPEVKVPKIVRAEVTAATWQQTFAAAKVAQKTKDQRFIDHSVNGRIYECDWTEDMHGTVALYASQGLWDEERGMTTIDPRHPSRQSA
jgi:hypothetical protein